MIDHPRPASHARLHLTDDAGIVFSERSQDLYVLNATAAFVWCCLEDGLERDQIMAATEAAYGVPAAKAETDIDDLLCRWQQLGLLAGAEANCVRWSTQSEEGENEALREPDAAKSLRDVPPCHSVRSYQLLTTSFRLHYGTAAQEAVVHPILAHLEVAATPTARRTVVELVWCAGEHLLLVDGRCQQRCAELNELAPLVKRTLLVDAIDGCSSLLSIHAGVVRSPRGCLLLPAAAGSGKSSLTAALIRAGFVYLSDEVALLEEETLRVRPVPISLCVKEGGWDLLAPRYPELRDLAVHHRWDDKNVRYLNPPPESLDPESEKSHPVRWIVFPRYTPGAETALRPLPRVEALHRLLVQCASPTPLDQAKVASLVRWIDDLPCFDMPMSSLDEAVGLLDRLCRTGSA